MKQYRYQSEYNESASCFWKKEPAKFVKLFKNKIESNVSNFEVLDIGAGEGKNAVYLASNDAIVTAVDTSSIALSRFCEQLNYEKCKDKILTINSDVREIAFNNNHFDLIIAYGIFHAFDNTTEIYTYLEKSMHWLKSGGYYIIATFTNNMPPPKIQNYLEYNAFVDYKNFIKYFHNHKTIELEHEVIKETHPTSNIEHEHSIVRIIIQKK